MCQKPNPNRRKFNVHSVAAERSHVDPCSSSGTSPPDTWESRVKMWCQHCENVEQLTHMIRAARGLQELASAIDVVRECKGRGIASEVIRCL